MQIYFREWNTARSCLCKIESPIPFYWHQSVFQSLEMDPEGSGIDPPAACFPIQFPDFEEILDQLSGQNGQINAAVGVIPINVLIEKAIKLPFEITGYKIQPQHVIFRLFIADIMANIHDPGTVQPVIIEDDIAETAAQFAFPLQDSDFRVNSDALKRFEDIPFRADGC